VFSSLTISNLHISGLWLAMGWLDGRDTPVFYVYARNSLLYPKEQLNRSDTVVQQLLKTLTHSHDVTD